MLSRKQPKVSILVPCYNVERFLPQCLDSIVNQTLKDIEIICINDGSTDNTLKIIKDYAKHDKRIVIIDKPNEGYGKSMNRGFDAATGEYIGIVESDDWVDECMFSELVKLAEKHKVDVVKSNFYEYTTEDGEKNVRNSVCPQWDCEKVVNPGKQSAIFWAQPSIWSSIYRRDFLNKNKIRFLESPGASYQDIDFNFKVWVMAKRAYFTSNAYLHYRCDNANSSVKSSGKIFCVCDEWKEIDRFLSQYPEKKKKCRKLIPHVKLNNYLWNIKRLTGEAQAQFVVRFAEEYTMHIKNGEFNRYNYDDKYWNYLMVTIYPHSAKRRFQKTFFDVIRPFYRTRIENNYKVWRVLGFKIAKRPLEYIGIE